MGAEVAGLHIRVLMEVQYIFVVFFARLFFQVGVKLDTEVMLESLLLGQTELLVERAEGRLVAVMALVNG